MIPLTRADAEELVAAMKDHAGLLGTSTTTAAPKRRRLRCTYAPDMSYGRYHEPVHGNEAFQWVWAYWTQEDADGDEHTHVAPESRGWRGLPHEAAALALLMGEDPSRDAGLELARRFA